MNFEIEFLPVGEASKAGDSIVVKYEGTNNGYYLMVIDGGNADSGQELIKYVRQHYGQKAVIANAILTHCDADHASGFREMLQELDVRKVWMHRPWQYASYCLPFFADKRFTAEGLAKKLREEYDLLAEIEDIAGERGISIAEPFAGQTIGPFTVLSPHKAVYPLLVPQFDRTPEPDQKAIEAAGLWIGKSPGVIAKLLQKAAAKIEKMIDETWDTERLRDGGKTSASNESSVVLYGDFGNSQRVLLTGDAGHWALTQSLVTAKSSALPMQKFTFVQVPHHGSRSNVGPTILDQVVGPKLPYGSAPKFEAFVSAPKDDDTHPRKMVLNAFIRRGGRVVATQGVSKCFTIGYSFKPGYEPATSLQFANKVEDYD